MKVSDFIVDFLARQGVTHVFGLTGGAVVHMFDSAARSGKVAPVFTHHEQAASFAAEGYARIHGGLGAAMVTTGPGGTNAITGLAAAWLDSIPCIFISGQVRLGLTGRGYNVRQVGPQHLDIVPIVSSITKYAVMVDDIRNIKYELQKAAHIAQTGRPGPVWVDIPLDMQWSSIEPDELPDYVPLVTDEPAKPRCSASEIDQVVALLCKARRPIILAGYGVRLAGAESEFRSMIDRLQVPFLTTWNVADLIASDHPLNAGRPGIFGQRGANLAMQNCDLILSLGSHLSVSLTSMRFRDFARDAKVVMVDIDRGELEHRTVRVDLSIQSDAKDFMQQMLERLPVGPLAQISAWREKVVGYKNRYNSFPSSWAARERFVHPYVFMDRLSDELDGNDIVVVDGGGTIDQVAFQAFRVKQGQRFFACVGMGAMGSGLPEAVGACLGGGGRRTICLVGDGSLQLNVQELQTIVHHKLPIKMFVLCNDGYTSIRATQEGFLGGNYVGSEASGGVSLPDYVKIAQAYGVPAFRIDRHADLGILRDVLETDGPCLCEIVSCKEDQPLPRQGFERQPDGTNAPRPLEDMFPYMERDEFKAAMIVEPVS
ncbi:MAG: thiamine pyrophosphate-binding protein [Sphaerospermopsis kisseleviana]